MGLVNVLLKLTILVLDLRETYDALNIPRLKELGQAERVVRDRKEHTSEQQQTLRRRRVGGGKRKNGVRTALTTVFVWNIFQRLEPVCDNTLAWFVPFYDSIKTLFLVWLLFTRSFGAAILMTRVIVPIVHPYEGLLAGILQLAGSLEGWLTALVLAFAHKTKQFIPISHVREAKDEIPSNSDIARARADSRRPPASGPGSSNKAIRSISNSNHDGVLRPKAVNKKQSSSALRPPKEKRADAQVSGARIVLQDLPVPRNPSDEPGANRPVATAPLLQQSPKQPATSSKLGPPPSSPTALRNFAFIPGQTPSRAHASIVSPTPQFPGGFGAAITHPYQSARIPVTSSMVPLTVASSPNHAGAVSRANRPSPALDDDAIVPPPASHQKLSSIASRKRKVNDTDKKGILPLASSQKNTIGSRKRLRDETTETSSNLTTASQSSLRKKPKTHLSDKTEMTQRSPTSTSIKADQDIISSSATRSAKTGKARAGASKSPAKLKRESQPTPSPVKTRLTRSRTKQNLIE